MAKWPAGVRPRGRGIQIRIWRHGKLAYSETLPGDPYKKADLASAVKRRDELLARQKLGLPLFEGDSGRRTFEDVAQRYLIGLASLGIDALTINTYTNQLNNHWTGVFGGWPVDEISTGHIKEALAEMDLAQKTKKNLLIPLSGVFGHAGIIPNPAQGITFGKRQKAPVERYRPMERDKVLAKLEGQDRLYFALLFATGLRPGEACALEWADWDGDQLSITKQITKGRHKAATKTRKARMVYVPQWVRPLLLNHSTRWEGGYIFQNTEGNPFSSTRTLNRAWKKAHQRARVPVRAPYACRHTRAAELLSLGVTPADAASQLGHSVQVFLDVYSEFIVEYADRQDFSRFEPTAQPQTEITEKS